MTGLEPLLYGALANIFTEIIKKKGLPLLDRYDKDLENKNHSFKKAAEKYIQNYEERHGTLKVVCVRMDAPVKLESVYTGVRVLNRSDLKYYESTESLHNLHRVRPQVWQKIEEMMLIPPAHLSSSD